MSKKIDFSFDGGFPLDESTLQKMQETYVEFYKSIIAYLGLAETGNYILSGVNVTGGAISAGYVYMDGDVIPFPAMTGTAGAATKLKKQTTSELAGFEDGVDKPVYITSTVIVDGTGAALSTFTRVASVPTLPSNMVLDPADLTTTPPELTVLQRLELLEQKNAVFTSGGGMVLWNKPANQIPAGWQEVVNWRGRIPVGMDITVNGDGAFINPEFSPLTTGGSDPGRTGGNKSKTLALNNIPKVTITGLPGTEIKSDGEPNYRSGYQKDSSFSFGGNSDGSTEPFSVLNPFRTVIFIEFVGV